MLANKYSAMNMSATKPEKIFEILFNLSFNKMLPTYCTMSGGFRTKRDKLEYMLECKLTEGSYGACAITHRIASLHTGRWRV